MIFNSDNRHEAKKYIGKKVKCWSDNWTTSSRKNSNVYTGELREIDNSSFYFSMYEDTLKIHKIRNSKEKYYGGSCFEFIEPYEEKDKNGNLMFDFQLTKNQKNDIII